MAADDKLKHCLDSLVGQTLPDGEIEIIAVDDCSTDDSYTVMCGYAREYPGRFIALSNTSNLHQGGAKNIGLTYARGEWIGFIDADDWIVPDYYERMLRLADETGADMVGCDYSLVNEYTFTPGQIVHNNASDQTGVMDEEKYRRLLVDTGSLVVKIYRRYIVLGEDDPGPQEMPASDSEVVLPGSDIASGSHASGVAPVTVVSDFPARLDIFPEDIFYEDNAVSNTWMLRCRHFEYIPEPLYFYYQHDTSTVHTISRRNLEDRIEAGRLLLDEARDEGYIETYHPEIEFLYTVLFYVNTLFSAMPKRMHIDGCYAFTKKLAREMKTEFPGFWKNPYYRERIHPEERRLIRIQMFSQTLFYLYYRLLWWYRDLRSSRNKKA